MTPTTSGRDTESSVQERESMVELQPAKASLTRTATPCHLVPFSDRRMEDCVCVPMCNLWLGLRVGDAFSFDR